MEGVETFAGVFWLCVCLSGPSSTVSRHNLTVVASDNNGETFSRSLQLWSVLSVSHDVSCSGGGVVGGGFIGGSGGVVVGGLIGGDGGW